jgi:cell division protein FtsB
MSRLLHEIAWLLPFGLLVCVVVVVPLRMLDEQGLPRYRALRNELYQVEQTNQKMQREVRDLQQAVRQLRSDPVAIERIATYSKPYDSCEATRLQSNALLATSWEWSETAKYSFNFRGNFRFFVVHARGSRFCGMNWPPP